MTINLALQRTQAEWLCRLLELNEAQFLQRSATVPREDLKKEATIQAAYCLILSNKIKNLLLANS